MRTSNEEVLARFEKNSAFKAARERWTSLQTEAFCNVARAVNDVGLDWWYVNIQPWQLRFGRKSAGRNRAEGVLGYVFGLPPRIDFNEGDIDFGLSGNVALDVANSQSFDEILKKRSEDIGRWLPLSHPRSGRWPDELETEPVDPPPSQQIETTTKTKPTNLILFGPPGTGKTFSTAAEAVRLCDGILKDESVDATRRRYRELVNARQVQFVTFHQSYAYEDFIEGLRPTTAESDESGGAFRLEPVPGVFREIATLAEQARKAAVDGGPVRGFDLTGRKYWKMAIGAVTDYNIYSAAIAGNYIALGWGRDVDWSNARFAEIEEMRKEWINKYPEEKNPSQTYQPWVLRNQVKVGDLVIVPYGSSAFRAVAEIVGDYYFELSEDRTYNQRRKVRWLLTLDEPLPLDSIIIGNFTMRTLYQISEDRIRKEALSRLLSRQGDSHARSSPDQFVLIIDEINRANISKVFGELITLIEPDKRLGGEHELKATLPYSKISFGVPDNLHIIGTMNTADRSIALLDSALRRRFAFRELAPQPDFLDVVGGINLRLLLMIINERIEYLFDREHLIGHGFFMHCESRDDIDAVMRLNVIPLLCEYFYEDWSKVAAVLGDTDSGDGNWKGGFLDRKRLKAPTESSDTDEAAPRYRWRLRDKFDYGKLQ